MYNYPENYEEAKNIIKKAINDDYIRHKKRIAILRLLILGTVATAIAAGLVVYTGDPNFFIVAPDLMFFMSPSIIPYLTIRHFIKSVNNGYYFELLSEEEVLEKARDYVKDYEKFKKKKMGNTEVTKDEAGEGSTL